MSKDLRSQLYEKTCLGSSGLETRTVSSRQKLWHRKTRNGCRTCRQRRIKCDEGKPVCKNCIKRQHLCNYNDLQSSSERMENKVFQSLPQSVGTIGWVCNASDELKDFDFYLKGGATNSARWHCPPFWNIILPQASWSYPSVRHCLLAISSVNQQYLCTTNEETNIVLRRGFGNYRKACQLLAESSGKSSLPPEVALIASLALFTFDWFSGRQDQSFVHANAAVNLMATMQEDQIKSRKTRRYYEGSQAGRQVATDIAISFFRDLHFPLHNARFLKALAAKSRRSVNRQDQGQEPEPTNLKTNVNTPAKKMLDEKFVLDKECSLDLPDVSTILTKTFDLMSILWSITTACTADELYGCIRNLDDGKQKLHIGSVPATVDQKLMLNRVLLFRALAGLLIDDMLDSSTQLSVDKQCGRMLDLIRTDLQLMGYRDILPCNAMRGSMPHHHRGEQQLVVEGTGYLGVLGIIAKRTESATLRSQAFDIMSLHRWDKR